LIRIETCVFIVIQHTYILMESL